MVDQMERVKELQLSAKAYRKKGDAMRKLGREDPALEAYRAGIVVLDESVELLRTAKEQIDAASPPLPGELEEPLHELVEAFGTRGGLLQRLKRIKEASKSYAEGATLEKRFSLPSTYNRLNAVKSLLLAGESTLRQLEPQLLDLAAHIDANLRADKGLSDSGWAWADLGDCMALLGKPDEARRAYSSFIAKAEIKSPERTLDVLKEIAAKLEQAGDTDAPRLQAAIGALQSALLSSNP